MLTWHNSHIYRDKSQLARVLSLVCGGGVHNNYLMARLQQLCQPKKVVSSAEFGVDPDWIEAMAFAWFAKQTIEKNL